MCIGESTTFQGYPDSLQKILNKKYPNKFLVVDCGIPGASLEYILNHLDENIAKYKPDFAVCMMGINDEIVLVNPDQKNLYSGSCKLKILKLFILLKKHITELTEVHFDKKTHNFYAKDNYQKQQVYKLYEQKLYREAALVCKDILRMEPDDVDTTVFLAMLKYHCLNDQKSAYHDALNIIQENKKNDYDSRQTVYQILSDYKKDIKSSRYFADKIINDKNVILNCSTYHALKNYVTQEQKNKLLERLSSCKQLLDQYYGILAIECMENKNYIAAEEYFKRAEKIRLEYPNENTYRVYKRIMQKLIHKNIEVICMQYPVRSVEVLKNILKNEQYYNNIEFISNENNFKDLLKKKKFNEVFSDQFAGDFGHYRQEGSILIAESVIGSLEKILN
jgi:hypothetical protein